MGSGAYFFRKKQAKTFGCGYRRGSAGIKASYPEVAQGRARDATDLTGLRAAGIGGGGVVSGVGVFLGNPALDYCLAFLEVCLGYDGVVDLFVG